MKTVSSGWWRPSAAIAAVLAMAAAIPAARQTSPEYGPPRGTLVIAGGGELEGSGIIEKFIALGGGAENGRFVIVPTAGGNRTSEGELREYKADEVLRSWKARGLAHVAMLHTADPKVADTEAFVKDLREATAVWFNGGRQWNIAWRRHWRHLRRRDHSGPLSRARRYLGCRDHDDEGAEPSARVCVPP